jgi:hypothetical protein
VASLLCSLSTDELAALSAATRGELLECLGHLAAGVDECVVNSDIGVTADEVAAMCFLKEHDGHVAGSGRLDERWRPVHSRAVRGHEWRG